MPTTLRRLDPRSPLPLCEICGLGQCHVRKLLRNAGMRTARALPLPDAGGSTQRGIHIHRRLLQSQAAAFIDRVSIAGRLRTALSPGSRRPWPIAACRRARTRQGRFAPPEAGRLRRSLTGAARGSRTTVRAGTEEWLRRGPNQRMLLYERRVKMHLHRQSQIPK